MISNCYFHQVLPNGNGPGRGGTGGGNCGGTGGGNRGGTGGGGGIAPGRPEISTAIPGPNGGTHGPGTVPAAGCKFDEITESAWPGKGAIWIAPPF